jgi:hypothetical protein
MSNLNPFYCEKIKRHYAWTDGKGTYIINPEITQEENEKRLKNHIDVMNGILSREAERRVRNIS